MRMSSRSLSGWRWAAAGVVVLGIGSIIWLVVTAWDLPAGPTGPPLLESIHRSFALLLIGELAVVMTFFLGDQLRLFLAIPAIGGLLYWALTEGATAPLSAAVWLAAAAGTAIVGIAVYRVRNRLTGSQEPDPGSPPDDPTRHLHNQFWIFLGLAPIAITCFLAVAASPGSKAAAAIGGVALCALYLFAAAKVQIRHCHDYPTRWRLKVGGPAALAAVGAIALTLISAAVIVFAAQRLGKAYAVGPGSSAIRSADRIGYYDELGWIAAAGLGALLVFALGFGTRMAALWRFRFAGEVERIRRRLAETEVEPSGTAALARRIGRARRNACLLDDLDWMVTVGVVAFLSSCISVLAGQARGETSSTLDGLVGFASWLLVGLVFVSSWVVRTAHKDTGIRKAIGTLWEITGFFPRHFHPLAPPSYGERAVPELRNRLLALCRQPAGVLVLAHSQGTLLCTASLLSILGSKARDSLYRVKLVTYGSMLQRSYGRSFPNLVRVSDLDELKAVLEGRQPDHGEPFVLPQSGRPPGWMNFGRTTDFLGGRLFVEPHRPPGCQPEQDRGDDIFFDDPPNPRSLPGVARSIPLFLHSFNYLDVREDPRFAQHVLGALEDLLRPESDGGPQL
jgi:hypothetical protein